MKHLFCPEGDAALRELVRHAPLLLAFDFDGTLAPIVPRPADARISRAVSTRLARLAARMPVAIVTGRAAQDVRARLGFEPAYVVGNHGAEGMLLPEQAQALAAALDPLRAKLQAQAREIAASGIVVEDKGLSIALHYRLAADRDAARAVALRLLADEPGVHLFGGKQVLNVIAGDAPDKADAVRALALRAHAAAALFAGDDVNDEPVFAGAPPHWLTVRIGRDDPRSRARYFLDSPREVALLLERLLDLTSARDP